MLNQADTEFLKVHIPFWQRLTDEEAEKLCHHTEAMHYDKGQQIYSADVGCIGVLLIRSGELRTYILSEDGREVTLFRLAEGQICILSASCLLNNITFDVNIDAEKDTELLLINAGVFSELQNNNEYIENFALKIAADRFSDVMWAMEQILFMKFDQRLAVFLIDESVKIGSDKLSVTHEKIAQLMGSAREVVSRMLKYFEKEGLVSLRRGGVDLLNKAGLRELSSR